MATLISPLQETDIPAYARLELEAFRTHPRINMLWPRGYTDDLYAYYEERKLKSFHDKDCHIMKAVDDQTSEIMGVSEWDFHLDPEATVRSQRTDPNEQPPANWPRSGNWEIRKFFVLEWEKRFGFREVRTLKADMRQFGWDQPYDEDAAKRVWMVRDVNDHVYGR
ncbi:hypothetical protein B0A54_00341 [Friedmanniomyces endolithicus]|uniref:N-acetyltransferase domain-containing protein n=1 Tax=Friedmanniomyces endolithicus TaxID=329885 RepID=A0A4U0VKP9_9PEZI|nr:hypothetical protein B0A54_00341 [Friedmanniomyces endolithicus]